MPGTPSPLLPFQDVYQPKTQPMRHQLKELTEHWADRESGLFWEQGLGKTKATLDRFGALLGAKQIDTLAVFTKPGLEGSWLREAREHLSADLLASARVLAYDSDKARNKGAMNERAALVTWQGPVIVFIGYPAAHTMLGRRFLTSLFGRRRVFAVADESHLIKTPGAKRTQWILALAKKAVYRTILTGTPAAEGTLDLYAQVKFLDNDFWKRQGIADYAVYKAAFAEWKTVHTKHGSFPQRVRDKNQDKLWEMLSPICRRLQKHLELDLPAKIYQRRQCRMSPEQMAACKAIADRQYAGAVPDALLHSEMDAEWTPNEDSSLVAAIVRLMRLMQIAGGFTPDGQALSNPKGDLLLEEVQQIVSFAKQQVIIWAVFRREVQWICDALTQAGYRVVRYDGTVKDQDRWAAIDDFRSGEAQVLVANPAAAGTGLNLQHCSNNIRYSRSYRFVDLLQAEDRTHRIGQKNSVLYLDLVCEDSTDERVLDALRKKKTASALVTADEILEWI